MRKYIIIIACIAGALILGFWLTLGLLLLYQSMEPKIKLTGDIQYYVRAEVFQTKLPSRQWMAHGIRIAKAERLAPSTAAHFYAYIASIYSDVLEETSDSIQASLATASLINIFYPSHSKETEGLLKDTTSKVKSMPELSSSAQNILAKYLERKRQDNNQFIQVVNVDNLTIPTPPKYGSLADKVALQITRYAVKNRTADDEEIIFFWEGIDHFLLRPLHSITVASIWQNIFFVEAGETLSDAEYAVMQKILAQGIAEALTFTWKAKSAYLTQSPSMRLPKLDAIIADPPFPSYPSEHAAASFAAATILDELVPEKSESWVQHANNAANSRLLAGVNFNTDIEAGKFLGKQVGVAILKKYFPQRREIVNLEPKRPLCRRPFCQIKLFTMFIFGKYNEFLKDKLNIFAYGNEQNNPSFEEVSEEAGISDELTSVHLFSGVSWSDYDSDGNLDLLINQRLYRNTGHGIFVPSIKLPGWGVFGDYNNDGCPDLYIVRRDDSRPAGPEQSDLLYKNNCDGTFTDVSYTAGISNIYHANSTAWIDYNKDGYLDIYVANWGVAPDEEWFYESQLPKGTTYIYEPNILYRNNGDGTFTDVTETAGVEGILKCNDPQKQGRLTMQNNLKPAFQPVWFDYNNDSFPDLLVIMDALISPFYRNNGDGTFTQVTEEAGLCAPGSWNNMGAAIGDYDGDGMLDMYVTNGGANFLWHNNGDGKFKEIADLVGAQDYGYGWGTESLDYDNDGALDILVVNGHSRLRSPMYAIGKQKYSDLDELFQNKGDGTFRAVGKQEGFSISNEIKYAVAVADYNNDGALDIVIPAYPWRHSTSHPLLFRNRRNGNNWITFQLIGTKSNRDGIGARIEVITSDGKRQIREVQAGSSYRAQSSPWPTFGLGKNASVDKLEIRWPSGLIQTFNNIKSKQKIIIREGDQTIH